MENHTMHVPEHIYLITDSLWAQFAAKNCQSRLQDLDTPVAKHASLRGEDFRGKNLSHIYLTSIDMQGSDCTGANFSNANLSGANLERVSFLGANLTFANLDYAIMHRVDMRACNISDATLKDIDASGGDFRDITGIQTVDFSHTKLIDTNWTNTSLNHGCFDQSDMSGAILNYANCYNTSFQNTNLFRADLSYVINLTPEQLCVARNIETCIVDQLDTLNQDIIKQALALQQNYI